MVVSLTHCCLNNKNAGSSPALGDMKQLLYGSTLRINRLFADYRRATHKKVVEFTTMGFKNSNQIVEELYHEGFIYGYQEYIENNQKFHRIFLKYTMKNKSLLTNVKYVSRPGNRIFVQLHHLKK